MNVSNEETMLALLKNVSDLIDVELGNDGKFHITIDSSIVIHIKGDEERIVDGVSFQYSADDTIALTGGVHHTNPINSEYVAAKVGDLSQEYRLLMDKRASDYKIMDDAHRRQGDAHRRRAFYIEAARRNMTSPRKVSDCGCK